VGTVEEPISTEQKALKINLDSEKFGTFAEIGAGQEVVRWFFHWEGHRRPLPNRFRPTILR